MLSIHVRIDRAQRLVRMLEQDAPLLALRVAELTPERQQSAKSYAAQLTAHARAELEKLLRRGLLLGRDDLTPHPPTSITERVGRPPSAVRRSKAPRIFLRLAFAAGSVR